MCARLHAAVQKASLLTMTLIGQHGKVFMNAVVGFTEPPVETICKSAPGQTPATTEDVHSVPKVVAELGTHFHFEAKPNTWREDVAVYQLGHAEAAHQVLTIMPAVDDYWALKRFIIRLIHGFTAIAALVILLVGVAAENVTEVPCRRGRPVPPALR